MRKLLCRLFGHKHWHTNAAGGRRQIPIMHGQYLIGWVCHRCGRHVYLGESK